MKIEASEHEVRLLPESDWEREQLERLRDKGVQSIKWADSWNASGNLVIKLRGHPWDRDDPGAR